MDTIQFYQLPLVTRLAVCAVMFMAWVLTAEFVIDRYGLHTYLPFYRVGNLCPYELVALGLIVVYWIWAHRGA